MKPVQRNEVLGSRDYETDPRPVPRARDRGEARAARARRRRVTPLFENRDTVLLQIQEMLRTERITRERAVLHEIETYNELVPGDGRALRHA